MVGLDFEIEINICQTWFLGFWFRH